MTEGIFVEDTSSLPATLGCLSAAELALATQLCSADPVQIKGLGAVNLLRLPTGMTSSRTALIRQNPCAAAQRPLCPTDIITAVTSNAPPSVIKEEVVSEEPEPLRQRGLVVGGLLALVVVVGGYTVYRQTKKKKKGKR
jgi:hypothetical protein